MFDDASEYYPIQGVQTFWLPSDWSLILVLRNVDAAAAGKLSIRVFMESKPEVSQKGISRYSDDPAAKIEADKGILEHALTSGKEMAAEFKKLASEVFNSLLEKYGSRGKVAFGLFFVALVAGLLVVCYLIYQCQ